MVWRSNVSSMRRWMVWNVIMTARVRRKCGKDLRVVRKYAGGDNKSMRKRTRRDALVAGWGVGATHCANEAVRPPLAMTTTTTTATSTTTKAEVPPNNYSPMSGRRTNWDPTRRTCRRRFASFFHHRLRNSVKKKTKKNKRKTKRKRSKKWQTCSFFKYHRLNSLWVCNSINIGPLHSILSLNSRWFFGTRNADEHHRHHFFSSFFLLDWNAVTLAMQETREMKLRHFHERQIDDNGIDVHRCSPSLGCEIENKLSKTLIQLCKNNVKQVVNCSSTME